MEALLRHLVAPGFPIRWEASKSVVVFILDHLDAFAEEYAKGDGNVMSAAFSIRARSDGKAT